MAVFGDGDTVVCDDLGLLITYVRYSRPVRLLDVNRQLMQLPNHRRNLSGKGGKALLNVLTEKMCGGQDFEATIDQQIDFYELTGEARLLRRALATIDLDRLPIGTRCSLLDLGIETQRVESSLVEYVQDHLVAPFEFFDKLSLIAEVLSRKGGSSTGELLRFAEGQCQSEWEKISPGKKGDRQKAGILLDTLVEAIRVFFQRQPLPPSNAVGRPRISGRELVERIALARRYETYSRSVGKPSYKDFVQRESVSMRGEAARKQIAALKKWVHDRVQELGTREPTDEWLSSVVSGDLSASDLSTIIFYLRQQRDVPRRS